MKLSKRSIGALAAALGMSLFFTLTGSPAGAGGDFMMTIEKVVDGDAPPGTVFVVDLNCSEAPNSGTTQVTFDAAGDPVPAGSNLLDWSPFVPIGGITCVPSEQPLPGFSTTYACLSTNSAECSAPGPQPAPIQVTTIGTGTATVTVTNTPLPPPPPPPPAPVAEPRFTG